MSRNLVKYPVTLPEIIGCLDQRIQRLVERGDIAPGDMEPYLLHKASLLLGLLHDLADRNPEGVPASTDSFDIQQLADAVRALLLVPQEPPG